MGLDFQQAEFEDLEQADRPGADDDGVRFYLWGVDVHTMIKFLFRLIAFSRAGRLHGRPAARRKLRQPDENAGIGKVCR
jgi:hypothetical protein